MELIIIPGCDLSKAPFHSLYNNEKEMFGEIKDSYFIPYGYKGSKGYDCIYDKKMNDVYWIGTVLVGEKKPNTEERKFQQRVIDGVFENNEVYGYFCNIDNEFYPYGDPKCKKVSHFSVTEKENNVLVQKVFSM